MPLDTIVCRVFAWSHCISNFCFIRMVGDEFRYTIRFDGVNFPENGPVMQRNTVKWQPSTEKMYMRDGVLKGDVNMTLLLKDKSHYRCDFKTTYK